MSCSCAFRCMLVPEPDGSDIVDWVWKEFRRHPQLPDAVWYKPPRRAVLNAMLDGVIYGLATGAIFAWMWPAVEAVALPGTG